MQASIIYWQQSKRAWAIARKDIRTYYSKGPVVISGILFPVFLFLAFIVGRNLTIDFVIPGLLGMILFFTATAISPAVAPWETMARTLERLMSCPLATSTIILGDILASFIFGIAISLIPIVIGLFAGVSISNPLILFLGIILAALCFSSLGLMLSAPPTSMPQTIMMLSSVVKFPVIFISGIFIPLDELPVWGQGISYISPLTYFTDIARHCFQGSGHLSMTIDLLVLLAFTIGFLVLAVKLHQKTMPLRI